MATAYKGTVLVRYGNGRSRTYKITASDVAAAAWVMEDASTILKVASTQGSVQIADIILTGAGGTDTTNIEIWVNGKQTGEIVLGGANTTATISRQIQGSPVMVEPGAQIQFIQRA
jgi:hypothetical protein